MFQNLQATLRSVKFLLSEASKINKRTAWISITVILTFLGTAYGLGEGPVKCIEDSDCYKTREPLEWYALRRRDKIHYGKSGCACGTNGLCTIEGFVEGSAVNERCIHCGKMCGRTEEFYLELHEGVDTIAHVTNVFTAPKILPTAKFALSDRSTSLATDEFRNSGQNPLLPEVADNDISEQRANDISRLTTVPSNNSQLSAVLAGWFNSTSAVTIRNNGGDGQNSVEQPLESHEPQNFEKNFGAGDHDVVIGGVPSVTSKSVNFWEPSGVLGIAGRQTGSEKQDDKTKLSQATSSNAARRTTVSSGSDRIFATPSNNDVSDLEEPITEGADGGPVKRISSERRRMAGKMGKLVNPGRHDGLLDSLKATQMASLAGKLAIKGAEVHILGTKPVSGTDKEIMVKTQGSRFTTKFPSFSKGIGDGETTGRASSVHQPIRGQGHVTRPPHLSFVTNRSLSIGPPSSSPQQFAQMAKRRSPTFWGFQAPDNDWTVWSANKDSDKLHPSRRFRSPLDFQTLVSFESSSTSGNESHLSTASNIVGKTGKGSEVISAKSHVSAEISSDDAKYPESRLSELGKERVRNIAIRDRADLRTVNIGSTTAPFLSGRLRRLEQTSSVLDDNRSTAVVNIKSMNGAGETSTQSLQDNDEAAITKKFDEISSGESSEQLPGLLRQHGVDDRVNQNLPGTETVEPVLNKYRKKLPPGSYGKGFYAITNYRSDSRRRKRRPRLRSNNIPSPPQMNSNSFFEPIPEFEHYTAIYNRGSQMGELPESSGELNLDATRESEEYSSHD